MKESVLSNSELSQICRSLSLLLHAGIGMSDGLLLLEEEEDPQRELLKQMSRKMDGGACLSQAMEESGRFPVYVTGMVRVGENTGRLEEALLALARYYDEQERMARQIKSALMYPSMLLIMMLVIISVLLIRVMPVFDEVYASLGGSLTGLAGSLLKLGQILEAALPVLCVVFLTAAVGVLLFSQNENIRRQATGWWQKRWGDKGVFRKIHDAHFAQALAMGLRSGLPVEEAVELAAAILKEVPGAAGRCQECSERLNQGESLAEVLRESGVLPPASCRMLELGIKGGSGDQVMEEIAGRLSEEAGQALEQKVALVEPAMVMTASLLVGVILLSVMLPLMHIMSAIG